MPTEVTDPALLAQLNGTAPPREVTDPALLAQLNGAPQPSLLDQAKRGIGLSARSLIQGAAGLPLMVEDAGYDAYKLATDPQFRAATWEQAKHPSQWLNTPSDFPSQRIDQALSTVLPTPQTKSEKVMGALLSMEGGAMTPQLPVPGAKAPAEFVSPKQQQAQRLADSLKRAQDQGYVVPPSTTRPTLTNRILETIGGNEATRNEARVINQQARNAGAATDLKLKPEMMTPEAVGSLKQEAGKAFESARAIPSVPTDSQYVDDLVKVLKDTQGSNASFPGSANPDIEKLVDTYLQPQMTGDSAVSAVKMLRQKASDAFRNGSSDTAFAYKGIANAIDKQLERGADALGGSYKGLVQQLRDARTLYAKASTIEDAMDPMGNVSGPALARAWNRGEPLTGNIKIAAEHAANFPKANLPANSSNISHLNMYTAPLAAMEGYHLGGWKGAVAGAALPFARGAARSYLLSGMGQSGARPQMASQLAQALQAKFPQSVAGLVNAPQ